MRNEMQNRKGRFSKILSVAVVAFGMTGKVHGDETCEIHIPKTCEVDETFLSQDGSETTHWVQLSCAKPEGGTTSYHLHRQVIHLSGRDPGIGVGVGVGGKTANLRTLFKRGDGVEAGIRCER